MLAPVSEQDVCDAVQTAKGPLRIVGGGTRSIGQSTGEVLSTSGLSGVELYEPGALTIVVKAGTPLADVEAALAAENQRLPFEPPSLQKTLGTTVSGGSGHSTIGGVVAANASGPRRILAGACRDSLIGVRFVDGTGTALKNGGRVMKNVTGYDLVKLLAGSHGTLGILTEVAFKVLPGVAATTTLKLTGLDPKAAIAALSDAMKSPFEVSAAAHVPQGLGDAPVTLMRLEGFEASVSYRASELSARLQSHGDVEAINDSTTSSNLWSWVRDVEAFSGRDGDLWKISVKPSDGSEVAARLGTQSELMFDWAGGLIWALTNSGQDIRRSLEGISGHATRVRGDGNTIPAFHPETAALNTLSQGIRQKFDPRGILNPGLMT